MLVGFPLRNIAEQAVRDRELLCVLRRFGSARRDSDQGVQGATADESGNERNQADQTPECVRPPKSQAQRNQANSETHDAIDRVFVLW
jgi:hypothetical protein